MKQTILVKLAPSKEQVEALKETVARFNEACNYVASIAFKEHTANKMRLQPLVYYSVREKFGLSAQMAIRAIAKVCEAYKRDKTIQPSFRPDGAMVYDQRILHWKGLEAVSLLTLKGREIMPIQIGAYQEARANRIRGQADLLYRNGTFYLAATIDAPEPTPFEAKNYLGVDLGIKNIAVDSDGEAWSSGHLNGLRSRHARLRAKLQSNGTKSSRRLLKKRSGKESLFARDVNHVISKRLVAKAKDTERGIALEELKGIRSRATVRKPQRRTLHSWSFGQLRDFIEYKARLAGVPVSLVNPAYTSQTCPSCGYICRGNRRGKDFLCLQCGFAGAADQTAALNIMGRAEVNQPNAGMNVLGHYDLPASPHPLGVGS